MTPSPQGKSDAGGAPGPSGGDGGTNQLPITVIAGASIAGAVFIVMVIVIWRCIASNRSKTKKTEEFNARTEPIIPPTTKAGVDDMQFRQLTYERLSTQYGGDQRIEIIYNDRQGISEFPPRLSVKKTQFATPLVIGTPSQSARASPRPSATATPSSAIPSAATSPSKINSMIQIDSKLITMPQPKTNIEVVKVRPHSASFGGGASGNGTGLLAGGVFSPSLRNSPATSPRSRAASSSGRGGSDDHVPPTVSQPAQIESIPARISTSTQQTELPVSSPVDTIVLLGTPSSTMRAIEAIHERHRSSQMSEQGSPHDDSSSIMTVHRTRDSAESQNPFSDSRAQK
eukprot:jgi/Hompol1/3293/HPOL_006454-RA